MRSVTRYLSVITFRDDIFFVAVQLPGNHRGLYFAFFREHRFLFSVTVNWKENCTAAESVSRLLSYTHSQYACARGTTGAVSKIEALCAYQPARQLLRLL